LEQNDRVRVVFENRECFELIIDHVKPEDEGIYKAVAINPLGEDMTVGRLTTTSMLIFFIEKALAKYALIFGQKLSYIVFIRLAKSVFSQVLSRSSHINPFC